jgi:hypothetical protein
MGVVGGVQSVQTRSLPQDVAELQTRLARLLIKYAPNVSFWRDEHALYVLFSPHHVNGTPAFCEVWAGVRDRERYADLVERLKALADKVPPLPKPSEEQLQDFRERLATMYSAEVGQPVNVLSPLSE